jgi:hypothetical protein
MQGNLKHGQKISSVCARYLIQWNFSSAKASAFLKSKRPPGADISISFLLLYSEDTMLGIAGKKWLLSMLYIR